MTAIAAEQTRHSRKPAGAAVGIPPRQVDFRHDPTGKRYFYADNGFATLFFATLSGIFPPGERFFMDSVRHYRHRIKDPTLQAQISGFIGQEAIHGREHERLNAFFTEQNIPVHYAERGVKIGLGILRRFSAEQQLACTIFMEHFTALLGEQLLKDEAFRKGADPETMKIWMWHALEELEHKSVAYDVYQQVSGSRRHRMIAFPLVAVVLLPCILGALAAMVAADGQLTHWEDNRKGWRLLFNGRKGLISRFLPKMLDFLKPDFHPDDHDTDALVREWREKLFGEQGTLNDEFRNRQALSA